jgi:hypothetical protein
VTSSAPLPTAAVAPAGGPGTVVVAAVQACREKDVGNLRALVSADVSEDAITAMFDRGTDVQLLSQSVPPGGSDSVDIDVSLQVLGEEGERIERLTWELERIDGAWRLIALPQCY